MSDPFAALLAKQAAPEVSEEDTDPFNSLLRKGKPAAAPAPSTQPAGGIPVDTRYTAPPKAEQDSSTLGKLVRGKGVLETTADVGDIVVGGFPAMVLGTIGEVTQRAGALVDGRGYREGAKAGAEFSRAMGERFGRPIFDNLVAAGLLDPKSRSVPMQAMDKIGGWLENAATIVEHDTGGKISKEDYLASVNGFMAAMGVKGVQAATAKALAARGSASQKSAWDTALERFEAEEQLARAKFEEVTPERTAAKAAAEQPAGDPLYGGNFAAEAAARRKAYEQRKAQEHDYARERFLKKNSSELTPSGERTGLREAQPIDVKNPLMDRTPDGQLFPVEDPLQTSRGTRLAPDAPLSETHRLEVPQASALDSGLLKVKENRLFDMTMEERLAVKNSTKITDPKVITAAAVGATGLGLAMAYEPSAEEAAMAIGAGVLLRRGGVGESMRELAARPDATPLGAMLEASAYTTSTLEKLADASPGKFEFKKTAVEQLLKREGVTKHERDLMTAALAQAPGDTITAKQLMVGLRVAAQDFELTPVKSTSYADYGLERIDRSERVTDLSDSIDPPDILQARRAELEADLPEMRRRAEAPPNTRFDDYPYVPNQAQMAIDNAVRSIEEINALLKAGAEIPAEMPATRIYRSPLELGSNNHFSDPNYFAHTRSFVEDGVRHVVELQSDLAQKAGKVPDAETLAKAKQQLEVNEAIDAAWGDVQYGVSRAGNYSFFDGLQRFFKREPELNRILGHDDQKLMLEERLWRTASNSTDPVLKELTDEFYQNWRKTATSEADLHYGEGWVDISEGFSEWLIKNKDRLTDRSETTLRYALQELANRKTQEALVGISEAKSKLTAGASAQVAPMLKDWHKRLVREELADAARNLEGSVRFATADTVAKVEGWPTNNDAITLDARRSVEAAERNLSEMEARLQTRSGATPAQQAEARELLPVIREDLRRARQAYAAASDNEAPSFRPEHQGIYDRYSRDVEKFLRQLGAQPIIDSAGHTWLEVPLGEQQKTLPGGGARTQIGGVDPALMKSVAAIGGTAALAAWLSNDKDKAKHAAMAGVLTGLGILAKSRFPAIGTMVKQTTAGIQQLVGNLSTDAAVTAPLLRRLTEHARAELKGVHDAGRVVAPFLEMASRLPAGVQKELNVALMNGSTTGIIAAIGKAATPGLLKEWGKVQAQLKAFGTDLQSVGLLKELRPDYFPRIVKDLPGLLNAIGKEYAVPLQRALDEATKRAGHPLDEADRAAIINRFIEKNLRGQTGQGKASFFKRRTIDNVSVDLEPFYVEPLQALPLYIGSVVRAVEKAKFFGRDAVKDPTTGKLDLTASIGNVVAREIDAGNLTPENFTRLTDILRTRFGSAYESPARPLQTLGQLTNIALLGNVFSGMMNLADIGTIAAQHGVVPLAAAVAAKVGKRQKITAADVGMAQQIMEEFVYGTREPVKVKVPFTERQVQLSMAKALDATFKFSGFKAFDQVMKEVALNSAFEKYSRLARTKTGEARIKRQYDSYFTTDMPQLLADLRAGAKTKLTVELAFRELSDAQPVTKIEMPQIYLKYPNARFAFALKSFMIKQINLIKKRGVDEIARGNFREGVGFLTRYTLMAGAAGATMDWVVKSLLGRDAETDWKMIPLTALKNLGLSEYVIDKARQGKGKEAILAATVPPVDPILNIVTADPEAVRYIPLVGRLAYDRLMDGAEKANAAKKLAEKKRKREEERTPSERRELERRALERRQRLLQEN